MGSGTSAYEAVSQTSAGSVFLFSLALVLLPLQNHQALLVRPVDQLPLDLACHDYEGLESSQSFAVMNRL